MGTPSSKKFIKLSGGALVEEAALTASAGAADANGIPALNAGGVLDPSIVNSKTTSAGSADAGKLPALGSDGRLDLSFMPTSIGPDTAVFDTAETLSAGDLVNVFDTGGGVWGVRKADATAAGKTAHGFVLAAFTHPMQAVVYFDGTNTAVSGLTPGELFLSTTAGQTVSAAPAGAGNVVQSVGIAVSATSMRFTPGTPIVRA